MEQKQLAFKVNKDLHRDIKILAARFNISMNLWLMRAISDKIKKDTQYDNPSSIKEGSPE